MLKITKVEKADRWELKSHKFSPLSRIFNVTAKCEKDEKILHKVMGKFCTEEIKAGQEYTFQIAHNNIFKNPALKVDDEISLKTLKTRAQPAVIKSSIAKKFT